MRLRRMVVTGILAVLFTPLVQGWLTMAVAQDDQAALSNDKPSPPTRSQHYVQQSFLSPDGTELDYWIMSPAKIEDGRKYPLVLALHGRGGNTEAATELGTRALRRQHPCFVMAPASTLNGHWAIPPSFDKRSRKRRNTQAMLPAALSAMDAVIEKHPIDRDRIYVTGQSMGGAGTFGAVAMRPDFFAAAIPIAGGWDPNDAAKMKDIPIWVFHGDTDNVVPTKYSREMVDALRKAGGSPKYTEYKDVGHNSWSRTYAAAATWEWLFQQKLAH